MNNLGKVYLVGAGCGDYDLITLRGKELLEGCDTVVYDSLIDIRLLDFLPDNAEKICVGKRAGQHSESQENINELLVQKAKEGKIVVRLKGGDPFVFGRGGEEIIALKENNIKYSVVPGISSAIAVPELAGIPVTHRQTSRSVHIITGHTADDMLPENMSNYAKLDGTLVFLMGLNNIDKICKSLIKCGKNENTPAAVISNGASSNQQIVRGKLNDIADKVQENSIKSPAIIVIGETASFDFKETINLPLKNISVTVTGTKRFSAKLSSMLKKSGACVRTFDYLNVAEYADNTNFDNALKNISEYKWIVLTSVNGAEIFFKRLKKLKLDIRKLLNIKFAVIGSGTAEVLENYGIFADLVPNDYTSSALGKTLSESVSINEKVLILRAKQGSAELTKILDENKISYNDIKTYDLVSNPNNVSDIVDTDFITFASASGVNVFFENGFDISPKTKIICIGEITANALKKHNISDFRISKISNADGILQEIISEAENEKIQTTESK